MVKKLFTLLLAALLLCISVSALAERPMVIDEADLFTADEIKQMEAIIQRIQKKYQMDAVVLTTRSTPSTSSDRALVDYADRYYEDNGYGLGEDRAGVLYMIDMNNRYTHLSTAGVMIDYMTDSRIEDALDAAGDYLSRGYYGKAAIKVLEKVEYDLRCGIEEGSFRFDEVTGARLTGLYNCLTSTEALVALIIGAAVALIIVASVVGQYSLSGSTYRYDLSSQSACKLTRDDEQFLRQTVSRVRTPPPSSGGSGGHSGGSGVHVSSGGMSHGGGGRRF